MDAILYGRRLAAFTHIVFEVIIIQHVLYRTLIETHFVSIHRQFNGLSVFATQSIVVGQEDEYIQHATVIADPDGWFQFGWRSFNLDIDKGNDFG